MFSYFHYASLEKRREQRTVSVYFGNELSMNYQVLVFQLSFNFSLVLIAVINRLTEWLFLQIGQKKKKRAHAFLLNLVLYAIFIYIKFSIIMSFRKPCHMPFRKLILPSKLSAIYTRLRRQNTRAEARYSRQLRRL